MTTALIYVHPCLDIAKYGPAARRWSDSYMTSPPGDSDHDLYVVLNGSNGVGPYHRKLFDPLPVQFLEHSNWGKDLGAFIMAAQVVPCDLLVCLGAHVHHHQPGWLDLIVRAYENFGPSLYGAFAFHNPRPHIRTTAFFIPPDLLNAYPFMVSDHTRYEFEHGQNSITLWSRGMGFEPRMITRRGVFEMADWHHVERSDCILLDQHTDRIGY